MNIRIKREIVKEINGVRRTLTVGQVIEIRDPDAASLIAHGYAESFREAEAPAVSTAPAAEAVAEAMEEALTDEKPVKRLR